MSQENVEIVRRMLARFSAGGSEGWLAYWDSDAEWTLAVMEALEGQARVYRGHEGLREFVADQDEALAGVRVDVAEFHDLDDVVLVLGDLRVTGATSGIPSSAPMAWSFEVRDGKVVRGRDYLDQDEARQAFGR